MFGLDIGNNSVKAVQLERRGDTFSLLAAGIAGSVGGGIMGTDSDLNALAQVVGKLLNDTKITSKDVNLSIPESQAFTRLIKLPYLSDEEVASAISWQAEPYIPIPINEASISHVILERHEPKANEQGAVDVLLVATPKSLIQRYLNLAEMIGLTINGIETELIATARSVSPLGATTVLVDLGMMTTDIAVVKNKQVVVSRSITTAGETLTRAISTTLSVSPEQAESYKKTYGLDPKQLEGKVKETLAPVFNVIIEEIKKSIQYYKAEVRSDDPITVCIVVGGGSGLAGVIPYLTENLGIEVTIGDPFAPITKDASFAQTLANYGPLYGVAVGLAENL